MRLPDWGNQKDNSSAHLPTLDRQENDSIQGSGTRNVFQYPHATALATSHHNNFFTKQLNIAMTPEQQALAICIVL